MEYYFHDDMQRIRDSINGVSAKTDVSISKNSITEEDIQASIDSIFNASQGVEILPNVKITLWNDIEEKLDSVVSDETGAFFFTIDCLRNYRLVAEKENYDADEIQVSATDQNADTIQVVLKLKEKDILFRNNKHTLNIEPFYYDFDKADIDTKSVIGVLTIVDILRKYPNLHIEINSHTDSRGTDEYNVKLSKRRSAVMKQWIVARGVDPMRISTNGYGETQLVNSCSNGVKCSEEEHAKNRRSEFVITKYQE
jgi:outer membrane protein OmpA-like peptidoglycan-associated protein